jgi:branched-chain amino acid transport system substrate-binding protein
MAARPWASDDSRLTASRAGGGGAAAREPALTIGCLYPLHGRGARFGRDSMVAAEMAAEEINGAGGVAGRRVRLLVADDRSDPTYAVRIAVGYAEEERVDFLMGVVSSAVALAVNEVSRQYRKIFVGTDHASSRVTVENFQRYYFRVSPNTLQSMRAGALYCSRQPWTTYYYIGPDYEYGHRQWEDFREFLLELRPDVRITGQSWPRLYEPDYTAHIEAAARARPDVVVHGFWGGDAVAFTRQALASGLHERCQLVSFDAGGNYEVFEALGDLIPEGLVLSARHHNNWPETAANRRFVQAFHARAGRYPSYAAHGAYVGVHFIARMVARAGGPEDPEALVEAAEGMTVDTPGDRAGARSWIRAVDHQLVRDYAVGLTGVNVAFPPATRMLGRWTVLEGERILPDEEEILKRRRAAR